MHLTELFNNREQALLIWAAIILLYLLTRKDLRKSLAQVLASLLERKILVILVSMALYICLQVVSMSLVIDWSPSLTKDASTWALFTAFVLVLNVNKAKKDPAHFRNVALQGLGLVILIEFLLDNYPFELIPELMLVPVVSFIVMMHALSARDAQNASARRVLDFMLALIGGFLIFHVISNMLRDFQGLMTTDNLYSLLLPSVLTITFIPYLYMLAVVMAYENCFITFRFSLQGYPELVPIAQRRTLMACRFNLRKIHLFEAELSTMIKRSPTKDRAAVINAVRELSMRKIADSGLS